MLKGIPAQISSDLLKALADMGHGDLIVIADDFYPPYTKSPNAISIQAKGNSTPEMLNAILQLLPIDVDYCASPIEYMVPDSNSQENGYCASQIKALERTEFYQKAQRAFATVCTSERQPYGCVILQKGVL